MCDYEHLKECRETWTDYVFLQWCVNSGSYVELNELYQDYHKQWIGKEVCGSSNDQSWCTTMVFLKPQIYASRWTVQDVQGLPEYTQWSTAGTERLVAHSVLELEASLNEFQIRIIHAQDDRDVWITLPTGPRYLFLLVSRICAGPAVHPTSCQMWTGGLFLQVQRKRHEAYHLPPYLIILRNNTLWHRHDA
jgi:hypothetical protein